MLDKKTLGFVGGGNMAAALVKGILHAKLLPPERVVVSDVKEERLRSLHDAHGIVTTLQNDELVAKSDVIVLAVKPQVIDKVLKSIAIDPARHLVISVAAGVPISAMEARLPKGTHLVRTMPNTPATALAGATAISAGTHATEAGGIL